MRFFVSRRFIKRSLWVQNTTLMLLRTKHWELFSTPPISFYSFILNSMVLLCEPASAQKTGLLHNVLLLVVQSCDAETWCPIMPTYVFLVWWICGAPRYHAHTHSIYHFVHFPSILDDFSSLIYWKNEFMQIQSNATGYQVVPRFPQWMSVSEVCRNPQRSMMGDLR